jgi:hypothetical protein
MRLPLSGLLLFNFLLIYCYVCFFTYLSKVLQLYVRFELYLAKCLSLISFQYCNASSDSRKCSESSNKGYFVLICQFIINVCCIVNISEQWKVMIEHVNNVHLKLQDHWHIGNIRLIIETNFGPKTNIQDIVITICEESVDQHYDRLLLFWTQIFKSTFITNRQDPTGIVMS